MSRRRVGAVLAIASASAFILIASTRIGTPGDPHAVSDAFQESLIKDGGIQQRNFRFAVKTATTWGVSEVENATNLWEVTLDEQRQLISEEMMGYNFPRGKYNISASCLEDLVPEKGGDPIRSVVITTWRSGSTFLGDVLNSQPGNFYHYEPLLPLEIIQIGEKSPFAESALSSLRQLLHCNYTGMEDGYLSYGRDHKWLMSHNSRLWDSCGPNHELCWDPGFLSHACRLFPFQSMKVVRLRLRLASRLLEDKTLNVRMILLVRDPRGTMQSRRHREWCPPSPDCSNPKRLCKDLIDDYWTAVELRKHYPDKFRVLRYEELSLNPSSVTQSLFEFLGLAQGGDNPEGSGNDERRDGMMESDTMSNEEKLGQGHMALLHPAITHFLETHTKADQGGVSSTHRDSRTAPFRWRKELTPVEIANIQSSCREAMRLWGYREMTVKKASGKVHGPFKNPDHEDFNPLGSIRLD